VLDAAAGERSPAEYVLPRVQVFLDGVGARAAPSAPAEIVEPLIALSIAYVAADVLLGGNGRHRLAIVFGFGAPALARVRRLAELVRRSRPGRPGHPRRRDRAGSGPYRARRLPALLLVRRLEWSPFAHAGAAACAGGLGLLWSATKRRAFSGENRHWPELEGVEPLDLELEAWSPDEAAGAFARRCAQLAARR
jgi:hypothetical protein